MTPNTETAADYGARATQHRPTDPAGIAAAARQLAAIGLKHRDIAGTLGLTPEAIFALLRNSAALNTGDIR